MRTRWVLGLGIAASAIVMGAGLAPIYFLPTEASTFWQNLGNVGQFVSGLFAPIAFIWVVVAVLLQSRELELQREELSNSRRALELQHEELKKTVEQHVQQTIIMTEELKQKNVDYLSHMAEEWILKVCTSIIDIQPELQIYDPPEPNSVVISMHGPLRFHIGEVEQLLKFYQDKNYTAFFDYVHRNIVSSIGYKEQDKSILAAAKQYGGGDVGIRGLAHVLAFLDHIEYEVSTEKLNHLERRLTACHFFEVKGLFNEIFDAIRRLQ